MSIRHPCALSISEFDPPLSGSRRFAIAVRDACDFDVAYDRHLIPLSARFGHFSGTRMLLSLFPFDGQGTLYEQLARVLKRPIVAGHFSPGERLPASRRLARMLGLSRNTVLTAYEILRAERLTVTNDRSGTQVAQFKRPGGLMTAPAALAPQSRYTERVRKLGACPLGPQTGSPRDDFYYGGPWVGLDLMRAWTRKLVAAARSAGPHYPDSTGLPALRRAIAQYLARRRGVVCTADDILIVGGTQQAVTRAARAVLNEGRGSALSSFDGGGVGARGPRSACADRCAGRHDRRAAPPPRTHDLRNALASVPVWCDSHVGAPFGAARHCREAR